MGFPGRPWVHGGGLSLGLTSSNLAVKNIQIHCNSTCNCTVDTVSGFLADHGYMVEVQHYL